MSHLELLNAELHSLDVQLPMAQRHRLASYCDELQRWNRRINLTGLRGAEMVRRLVVEPVWTAGQLGMSGILVDVGSGNGSPAIPMHIVQRFQQAHLIEARSRKAAFLRHLTSALRLSGVSVHRARFDEACRELGPADWITLQGIALTAELVESMRAILSSETRILWITAHAQPPIHPVRTLRLPHSRTQGFLFCADLS